jgi:hypothetical protein
MRSPLWVYAAVPGARRGAFAILALRLDRVFKATLGALAALTVNESSARSRSSPGDTLMYAAPHSIQAPHPSGTSRWHWNGLSSPNPDPSDFSATPLGLAPRGVLALSSTVSKMLETSSFLNPSPIEKRTFLPPPSTMSKAPKMDGYELPVSLRLCSCDRRASSSKDGRIALRARGTAAGSLLR